MAIKLYSSTLTFHCPKCNTVIKKERHDDAFGFLCVFLFIPVGLIALIVYLFKKITNKDEFNKYGEQIIRCKTCNSIVAIRSFGLSGTSRIITQEKDLLKIMTPLITYLNDNYSINCYQYRSEEKYSESLGLRFTNSTNNKCYVYFSNIHGQLKMKIDNGEYEPFSIQNVVIKIIKKLCT